MPLDKETWDKLRVPFPLEKLRAIVIQSYVGYGDHRGECEWAAYVPGEAARERLDSVLGPTGFDFTVISTDVNTLVPGEQVSVTVCARLTIDGAVRDDFASDMILEKFEWEDKKTHEHKEKIVVNEHAAKSACTKALTRCAAAFGIGIEVNSYPRMFTKNKYTHPDVARELAGRVNGGAAAKASSGKAATNGTGKMSKAVKDKLAAGRAKLTEMVGKDEADHLIKNWSGTHGVSDMKELTDETGKALVKDMADYIKAQKKNENEDIPF